MRRWLAFLTLALLAVTSAQSKPFQGWVLVDEDGPTHGYLVLQSREDLSDFRAQIPERVPSKKQPAAQNKDPLKTWDAIDFEREVLVVAWRSGTISAYPELLMEQSTDKAAPELQFALPEAPPEARPLGWGVYTATIVKRTERPLKVSFVRQP